MTNAAQGRTAEARRARYSLDTYYLTKNAPLRQPQAAQEPQLYTYPERHYSESGFCEMALVWALSDMGIPRRRVLLMSQEQALITLAQVVKERMSNRAIWKAAHRV